MSTKTKTYGQHSADLRHAVPVARRQLWRPRGDTVRREMIGAEGMAAELDRLTVRTRLTTEPRTRRGRK